MFMQETENSYFKDYGEVTLNNVKMACEKYFKQSAGSCHVLDSEKYPVCTKDHQIARISLFPIYFDKRH